MHPALSWPEREGGYEVSGPVDEFSAVSPELGVSAIEVREGRSAKVGPMGVLRVLPTKGRRTVGPWCFADLVRPDDIAEPPPLEIGPHPHIGLATATWLFRGTAVHSDSLGTEQLIRPGELNLMTAGRGIAHAELGVEAAGGFGTDGIMGVELWLAQTDATRQGGSRFEHLGDLPVAELSGDGRAHVFVGEIAGESSPAGVDHPTIGLDVTFDTRVEIPADPRFEYGVVPVDRPVKVEDAIVETGSLALVPTGYERLVLEAPGATARLLLLGGEPLGVEIKMWWNFVARTLDEITDAWRAWQVHDDDRFGPVPSKLARIEAPTPPWLPSSS
jgi:redox-sensitive bicupin YhaK (pirin superfamily)